MEPSQNAALEMELEEKQKRIEYLAGELDRRFKDITYSIGRSQFANLMNMSYSYISEILNTSGIQKPFQAGMIPALIVERPEKFMEVIVNFVCDLTRYEHPEKKPELPPKQELDVLKNKLKSKGLDALFPEHF
jgi:hypothetical protein